MPHVVVCPLSRLAETVASHRASHVLTLINAGTLVTRPTTIAEARHLFIGMSDIVDPLDGHILPAAAHVESLLAFVRGWERADPLVIHCYAGISRSTAAAFTTLCALAPERREAEIAQALRHASPTAIPNGRLVAVADDMLGRGGRMVDAVRAMSPGLPAAEGVPFMLTLT